MQRLSVQGLNAPYYRPCAQGSHLRTGFTLSAGDLWSPYRSVC